MELVETTTKQAKVFASFILKGCKLVGGCLGVGGQLSYAEVDQGGRTGCDYGCGLHMFGRLNGGIIATRKLWKAAHRLELRSARATYAREGT